MKNFTRPLIILTALLYIGCQKSSDLDYGIYANWHLQTDKAHDYSAKSVTIQTTGYFSCTQDTSIQVFFANVPPVTGKYHVVDESKAVNGTLGPKDVAVEFNVGITNVYLSIDGTDSANVVVTDQGFRHLYVPTIRVVHFNGGPAIDTTTGYGDISFPNH